MPDALDLQILRLLHQGHTEAAIAKVVHTSYRTVQRRIQRLSREFGVASRFALGAAAQRRGLLDDEPRASESVRD
ncbi:helix-turn-helix domain-containing protein [Streptomyces sp. JJ36]|uniref:helix-turn-helix domain-containing protein n=1 Tax=Streptomyces sp. JJ36 TaxID=2736645 RepID=UPI001F1DAD1E|nr:helix-turn-helix domain-containing protein [Streptomyces sp. JJ36]MCF6525921.1 helix-turn-helix domain-containing protein [Streptomyces sp. JJ36]